jgi:hypothetical protein
MDLSLSNIVWWVIFALFFVFFWQIAKAAQSISDTFRKFEKFLKKFEDFKITELPPSAAAPAPVAPPAAPAIAVGAPSPSAPVTASDSVPGEIVAVIAAAVDSVMSGPHRILGITPLGGPNPFQTSLAWAAEGRRHIFQSHKLR